MKKKMKNKNLFLYLLFFLFIILASVLLILIFFLWRDISRVESKLQLVNETVTLDNDFLFKKKVDELGSVTNDIIKEQDKIFEQFTDRYYQIVNRMDNVANQLTGNINNLTSDKVTIGTLNALNDSLHSMLDDLLFLSEYYANRTDYIERYVYNNSKALVEHLGYSISNTPSLTALYPSQNESCGQCTFVLDHDSTTDVSYTIKPFLHTNINNTYLMPLLDLNEADILINGTVTLKEFITDLLNNDLNISQTNHVLLYNQEVMNNTMQLTKQLLIQLINSNENLSSIVENSFQYTNTQSSVTTNLPHVASPELTASFVNSNYTPFLNIDSHCTTFITSISGSVYSYKTSVFCSFLFSIKNNTDSSDFELHSLGPLTIDVINYNDIPADYGFPVKSLFYSFFHLYYPNSSTLTINNAENAFRYKTPLQCLIELQPLPITMDKYQMKILLSSDNINPNPMVFSHLDFNNNFQYNLEYSFYS